MIRLLATGMTTLILGALPGAASAAAATARGVAVVVDFADGKAPLVLCVNEAGQSDATVLADGLHQAGRRGLRYGTTGLLCAIDGQPKSGCGQQTGTHYSYWAYFQGTPSQWTYAHQGLDSHRADTAVAIGLRFEASGTGTPGDPAPRTSSESAVLCPVLTPVTSVPVLSPPIGVAGASTTTTATQGITSRSIATTSTLGSAPSSTAGTNETGGSPVSSLVGLSALAVVIGGVSLLVRGRRNRGN